MVYANDSNRRRPRHRTPVLMHANWSPDPYVHSADFYKSDECNTARNYFTVSISNDAASFQTLFKRANTLGTILGVGKSSSCRVKSAVVMCG